MCVVRTDVFRKALSRNMMDVNMVSFNTDSGNIDMRSLDSSLSEIETDCESTVNLQRSPSRCLSRPLSPLHNITVGNGIKLTDLFLNQGTGYSYEDIRCLKPVQRVGSEQSRTTNEVTDSVWDDKCKHETIRYELTKKLQRKTRKDSTHESKKHYSTKTDQNEIITDSDKIRFEYIDTIYLKGVCSSLAKLNPDKAFYVREIVVKEDKDGDRLIFISIIMKRLDFCNVLIGLIPDECFLKTAQNKLYQTALHLAVLVGCPKLTRRFLVAGVQVDRRDYKGDTALHIACKRGSVNIMTELLKPVTYLEAKQNPYDISYQKVPQNLEIRNSDGLTCLHLAAYNKNTAAVDLLLSKYADINAVDMKNGMTCLHIFTEVGDVGNVQHMLRKPKVNVNARTYAGFTALEIANCRNHSYVAYLLLCAGAKPKIRKIDSDEFRAESDSD